MSIAVRTADPDEFFRHPELTGQAGTATVLSGTGAMVMSIDELRSIAEAADALERLEALVDALQEEAWAFAMAVMDEDDTGIANTLWMVPVPEGRHGPRLKVMIDPMRAVRPGGVQATVPFDPDKPAEGPISEALEAKVRAFIALNREALMKEWRREYSSSKKFLADLEPLPKR